MKKNRRSHEELMKATEVTCIQAYNLHNSKVNIKDTTEIFIKKNKLDAYMAKYLDL